MQILRYSSLTEPAFLGCVSAFVDSLSGTLNSAVLALRRLEGQTKGAAFAFEIQLDQGRYGALVVLERWAAFVTAFARSEPLGRFADASARTETAARLLEQANQALDAAVGYTPDVVATMEAAFQTVQRTFDDEQRAASQAQALGPLLPAEFLEYRRVFLGDLAAR